MTEKPIIFTGPMVRAILEGRKTQTRRIMKPQPVFQEPLWQLAGAMWSKNAKRIPPIPSHSLYKRMPYHPGDTLWVRETWNHANRGTDGPYTEGTPVFYREDYRNDPHGYDGEKSPEGKYRKWLPSVHMPRAASRITLEVTDVYGEQVQSVSEDDVLDEGMEVSIIGGKQKYFYPEQGGKGYWESDAIYAYSSLWNSIYGPGAWEANPWVWVICFRVLEIKK